VQLHGARARRQRDLLLGLSVAAAVPAYFERMIPAVRRGEAGRWVHLGHWDDAPSGQPGEFARAQARMDEVLLDRAMLAPGQRVLDVGCGFGATLAAVNRRASGMQLTGVNIDPRQLALCADIAPLNGNALRWHAADACALPFADASFERVLCVEAMFHFSSRAGFLAEAARVLVPGGLLVASDIVLQGDAASLAAVREGFGPWPEAGADHRALAAEAGLQCDAYVDATRQTLPSHRYTTPPAPPARPDALVRAALALRRLHEEGRLQYLYLCFTRLP
jgi:SAM-dependent methyltransferase